VSVSTDPIPLLRVSVVPIVIFLAAVVFLFVLFFFFFFFFFVWLLSKEDIGGHWAARNVREKAYWIHSEHAQWYASPLMATTECVDCYNDHWGGYVFLLFQVL
jgi:hypothetical protein